MTHRHGMTGRMLALALAMIMIVTSLPQTALTARAAEPVESAVDTTGAAVEPGATDEASGEDASLSAPKNEQIGDEDPVTANETDNAENVPADDGTPEEVGDPVDTPADESTPAEDGASEETPGEDGVPVEETEPAEAEVFEEMDAIVPGAIKTVVHYEEDDDMMELFVNTTSDYVDKIVFLYYKNPGESEYTYACWNWIYEYENSQYDYGAFLKTEHVLLPDTNYDYKIVLTEYEEPSDYSTDPDGNPIIEEEKILNEQPGTYKTPERMKSLKSVSVEPGMRTAKVDVTLNFKQYYYNYEGPIFYLHLLYAEAAKADTPSAWDEFVYENLGYYWDEDGEYEYWRIYSGDNPCSLYIGYEDGTLSKGTEYKYKLVVNRSEDDATTGFAVSEGTFKTKEDTRQITKVTAKGGSTSATVSAKYEGGNSDVYEDNVADVYLYARKKGDASAPFTERDTKEIDRAEGTVDLSLSSLENEADYEYIVVLWKKGSPTDPFDPAQKGLNTDVFSASDIQEFSTKKEGRTLGTVTAVEGITTVRFGIPFSGSYDGESSYAALYYRKNGTEDAYTRFGGDYSYNANGAVFLDNYEVYSTKLEKGQKYDYIVILSGSYSDLSYNQNALVKAEVGSDEAIAAGILDRKTGIFETKAESRAVTAPVLKEAGSRSAKVTTGFTGSYEGEITYVTVFWSEAGKNEWAGNRKTWNSNKAEDSRTVTISPLTPGAKYDVAVVLSSGSNVSNYPVIDSDKSKLLGESGEKKADELVETKADGRKLTAAVAVPGYKTAEIRAAYEGNPYNDTTYLIALYRNIDPATGKGTGNYIYTSLYSGSAEKADVTGSISSLDMNTKYECIVVLCPDATVYNALKSGVAETVTEQLGKLDQSLYKQADFATLAAAYGVTVTKDDDKSDVGYTVLNVELTGDSTKNNDGVVDAKLYFDQVDGEGTVIPGTQVSGSVVLMSSRGYKAVLVMENLAQGADYAVTKVELKVNGTTIQTLPEKAGETIAKFKTDAAGAPTGVTVPADVYLNLNNGTQSITAAFTPANANKSLICTADDATIVTASGASAVIGLTPLKIGETTVHVKSALAADKDDIATFKVHVGDYILAEEPAAGSAPVKLTYLSIEKGKSKEKLAVYSRAKDGDSYAKATETIVQTDGKSIVSWAGDKLTGINYGYSQVTLKAGEYPVCVYADVTITNKAFLITGLTNTAYPAIPKGEVTAAGLEVTVAKGQAYTIEGLLTPINTKLTADNISQLKFTSSKADTTIAGNVITVGASDADITVEAATAWTEQKAATIKLHVLEIPPALALDMGYVLTNVASTLKDVKLDDGWTWDDESAPLFTAAVRGSNLSPAKTFTASYTKDDKYPVASQRVTLNITTMTDAKLKPESSVLQLKDGTASVDFVFDTLGRNMSPQAVYSQLIGDSKYVYKLSCDGSAPDVVLGDYTPGSVTQSVSFTKDGTYNFTLDVLAGAEGKTSIATAKAVVKVVKDAQIQNIRVKDATLGDSAKTALDAATKAACLYGNKYTVTDAETAGKGLILTVETTGSDKTAITETKLDWKTSDPSVATVSYDETTRIATIKPGKEQGHTTISITALDEKGTSIDFIYQYQDRSPRVDKTAVKVNLAYDTNPDGKRLAYSNGAYLEIVPVYNTQVVGVKFYDRKARTLDAETTKTERKDFSADIEYRGKNALIMATADAKTGKNNLWMVVTVKDNELGMYKGYPYPLTITASVKKPSVSIKAAGKINLFYIGRDGQEYINVGVNKEFYDSAPTVGWKDDSSTTYGFEVGGRTTSSPYPITKGKTTTNGYPVSYLKVRVNGTTLADKDVDKGTLTVTLKGIRKEYGGVIEKKGFKIAWTYKKPVLATVNASTSIVKDIGIDSRSFYIINKTEAKNKIYYATGGTPAYNQFSSMTTSTAGVTLTPNYSTSSYTYTGSKNSEKINMTLDNDVYWREPLTVTHTVKNIKPKAVLNRTVITTNSNLDHLSVNDTYIKVKLDGKNTAYVTLSDVEIQASGNKEKDLVEKNFINFYASGSKANLCFNQNALKAMGGTLAKGTYKFKITPYYINATTGKSEKLNQLTLSIKVADMGFKLSAKGGLDIAKRSYRTNYTKGSKTIYVNQNVVKITPKFANLPTGYTMSSPVLKGQYADCFDLYYNNGLYLGFKGIQTYNEAFNKRLKAGMTIPLGIEYTVSVGGRTVAVLSGTFNVKITQSVPKVKVTYGNNQTLYAAAADILTRQATLTVPDSSRIYSVYGELDCDKDGNPDITVTDTNVNSYQSSPEIEILDMDAVYASAKGKVLSIPVTVKVVGSDGIVKDSSTVIKVKVKR